MIKVDFSIVIQIINFVFLIWILNVVLYKPIRNVMARRKERIGRLERSIQTSIRNAEEKDELLISGIKKAREKGLSEKEALIRSAEYEEKKIIQAIHTKTQEELAGFRDKIAKDIEQVRISLQEEIDELARSIGQKILGRPVE